MSGVSAGEVREDEGADPIPASLPGKSLQAQLRAKPVGAFTHHQSQLLKKKIIY